MAGQRPTEQSHGLIQHLQSAQEKEWKNISLVCSQVSRRQLTKNTDLNEGTDWTSRATERTRYEKREVKANERRKRECRMKKETGSDLLQHLFIYCI